jgi:hypothetical protein
MGLLETGLEGLLLEWVFSEVMRRWDLLVIAIPNASGVDCLCSDQVIVLKEQCCSDGHHLHLLCSLMKSHRQDLLGWELH